tara:strand:- start:104117 stop:106273 length:2157 start_codon:yes stop_codon:yes gene_type:complete
MKNNYLLLFLILTLNSFASLPVKSNLFIPEVSFDETIIEASESAGTITLSLSLSEAAATQTQVDISLLLTNATAGNDFTLTSSTITFPAGELSATFDVQIADNTVLNADFFIAATLSNPSGVTLGDAVATLYILDDEAHVVSSANELAMNYLTSFSGLTGAEIVAHDPISQKLFVSNSGDDAVGIIDFSNPENPTLVASIPMAAYGIEVTSVAVKEGYVAAAVKGADQANGKVVFMNSDGTILYDVEVGVLPDMITFTPDGTKILVANEGEPNTDYTVDPEGSISIIDLTPLASFMPPVVIHLNFNAFDSQMASLKAAGVRIYGPGATVSQDLEPEYIAVSADSQMAWVSLQENNAYAIVDLSTPEVTAIVPFGYKDHSLAQNAFDSSNRLDFVFMSTWKTLGMYQPDGIATFNIDGTNYLITANEGDSRDYDAYSEEERIKDIDLDPVAFPNAEFLQEDENLGRLNITTATGDTDGDGDFDQLYSYGARSFSIFNLDTQTMVYDSGDWLERIVKEDPIYGQIFNATNDENAFKNRSDDKGPEPEAVIVKEINEELYAFVGMERIGGIAVFKISDPANPTFETYQNSRDNTVDATSDLGDLAPEGIIYISPDDNDTGKGLIVVANEVSATISVYTLDNNLSIDELKMAKNDTALKIYPNPSNQEQVFFDKPANFKLYDISGKQIMQAENAAYINTTSLKSGIYIVKNDNGASTKLVVR